MSDLNYMDALLDGVEVEWKEISETFHLKKGYTPSKSKTEFWENGDIPWFRMDDIRENGQILDDSLQKVSITAIKEGNLFPANSIIISTSATIGEHALVTVPFLANQRFTNLSLKPAYTDRFEIKFIFYYCFLLADWCKDNTTMSSFASVDMNGFRKFQIPIPPLNVQAKIVQILDTFTELTAELIAELVARQQQYVYYRDQLLTFEEEDIEWQNLGELATLRRGRVMSKGYLIDNIGSYPVYSSQTANNGEIGKINTFDFEGEYVNWTTDGANAGTVFYRTGKFSTTYVSGLIKINDTLRLNYKYLFYWLSIEAKKHVNSGMGNPKLMSNQVEKIPVPIPSLSKQKNIVAILDKFEALTTSLTEGLPREIALRQKQYEYYRELLLSFPKPKVANHD